MPDPSRVVVRPFHLALESGGASPGRIERLILDILALDRHNARLELDRVLADFGQRHWQIEDVFARRFEDVVGSVGFDGSSLPSEFQLLIGAFFCHEYSYAAAAVMNPTVVPHPDQSGMQPGSLRIVIALRTVGEGHISTISFREGIIARDRHLTLQPHPPIAMAARPQPPCDQPARDGPCVVSRHRDSSISGTVIFPITEAQRNGLEDLRLTEFMHDDGSREWIGTYTAYSGRSIASELLRTHDFGTFALVPLKGSAARNKGMALFPRKIDGRYVMLGRQDGKNLYLLHSADLGVWEGGDPLLGPRYPWEFVQIGNCGPPIELDEGWLVLTHGVGAMRKYAIGAVLLDRRDPRLVLARTPWPLLAAADEDREGYVPNVLYTCGAIRNGDDLFMPYGVADSSVRFAFIPIAEILACMT